MNTKNTLFLIAIAISFSSCKKVTIEDFYGGYSVTDNCGNSYSINIRESSIGVDNTIVIDGFAGYFDYTHATVDGKNITFDDSEMIGCGGGSQNPSDYVISGTGTLNKDELEITYTWSRCGDSGQCTATAIRN